MITEVIRYQTSDGTVFESADKAAQYEVACSAVSDSQISSEHHWVLYSFIGAITRAGWKLTKENQCK